MKSFSTGLSAALLVAGFGFGLTACGGETPECEDTTQCSGTQVCSEEGVCVDPPDLCADVSCPGAQTCNGETGACEGDCCLADNQTCGGDPRFSCDEAACEAGEDPCVQVTCPGDGPNLGCNEGFHCVLSSRECQADCADGCEDPYAVCNMTTGQCEDRLPVQGELGTLCDAETPCNSGLTCDADFGMCTKGCSSHAECGAGALCNPLLGLCQDLCRYGEADACAPGFQCTDATEVWGEQAMGAATCMPFYAESTCTENCTPDGHACDPARTDECQVGSSCATLYGDNTAMCARLSCHIPGQRCEEGDVCAGLGGGLTVCLTACDPTDATACGAGADNEVTCAPGRSIDRALDDMRRIDAEVESCFPGETEGSFEFEGSVFTVCYQGCTTGADCDPGEACLATTLPDGTTEVNACGSYAVSEGTCDTTGCGANDCLDLPGDGTQADPDSVACYAGCTEDADCNAAFGGRCEVLSFTSGERFATCSYPENGALCLHTECDTDVHCGTCTEDTECGEFNGTSMVCDRRTLSCKLPIAEADAAAMCAEGAEWRANAIINADGTEDGSCVFPCSGDADCRGGTCDTTAGFCVPESMACNSVGQCEALGCTAATQAEDCLHGTCSEGTGPAETNVCE